MVNIQRDGVIFTFNQGDVDEVETTIISEIDSEAMPLSPATEALLYDFNGVGKTINVRGKLSNTGTNRLNTGSAITINEQRQWLEKAINGFQSGLTFTSNYSSSFNGTNFVNSRCLKSTIRFIEKTNHPNELEFQINLLVGGI